MHEYHTRLSDTLVLWVTTILLAGICTVPVLRALADSVQQWDMHTTIIVPDSANRDYTALLSYIFSVSEDQIDQEASAYIRDVDDYRSRVARGIVENKNLIIALYALTDGLPEDLQETYQKRVRDFEDIADKHLENIVRYVNNDTFLIKSVSDEYQLEQYTFFEQLTQLLGQSTTVETLSDLRKDSYQLRIALAKLYEKMRSFQNNLLTI
ncbi:MAG: hypothetical protein OYG31_00705 [Candidatus Kaiserbacteria bacterium]|nr:hypothetical protein [Candidatus Kaiserbacteria bacterium]